MATRQQVRKRWQTRAVIISGVLLGLFLFSMLTGHWILFLVLGLLTGLSFGWLVLMRDVR